MATLSILVTLHDEPKSHQIELQEAQPFYLGRSADCDLMIPDNELSRKHLSFRFENGKFFCVDENSTNGVILNQQKIKTPIECQLGQVFHVGQTQIKIVSLGEQQSLVQSPEPKPIPQINSEYVTQSSAFQGNFFDYKGSGTELALLFLKNIVLTILTLGIYSPWARTNTRRYIWGHVTLIKDPMAYTGTGKELFWGWVKLLGIYFAFAILSGIVGKLGFVASLLSSLISFVGFMLLFSLAAYGGYRYRLSRTSWRKIHLGVDKDKASTKEFVILYIKGLFLSFVTLGLYYPYYKNNILKFLTDRTWFGSQRFSYDAVGKDYFKVYARTAILTLITFGIYFPWAFLHRLRFRLQHTYFSSQKIKFEVHLEASQIFIYALASWAASILTLGLATPWVLNWGLGQFFQSLKIQGNIPLQDILQQVSQGQALADAAADDYDVDLFFF